MDREAIAAHIKSHTYKTMLGEYDMRNQLLNQALYGRPVAGPLVPRGRRRRLSRLRLRDGQAEDKLGVTLIATRGAAKPRGSAKYRSPQPSPAVNGRGTFPHHSNSQNALKNLDTREDWKWPFAPRLSDHGGFTLRWKRIWPGITRVNVRPRKARLSSIARQPRRSRSSGIWVSTNGPAVNTTPIISSCTCTNA